MLSVIYYTVWAILIADSLLLILLILAQESKSQGLGGLGGGMDMSFGGHTQRKVKRLTTACAIIFGVGIITLIVMPQAKKTRSSHIPKGAEEQASPMPSIVMPKMSINPATPVKATPPPANVPVKPPANPTPPNPVPANPAPAGN